jgi:cytochrome o ubiquinol oxidase subunit 3
MSSSTQSGINTASNYEEDFSKVSLGFWVYLMTDCVLFATLFATYLVLHHNTNGGPSASDLFSLPYVLVETLLLLTSSFTSGLALLATHRNNRDKVLLWLSVTAVLGFAFLAMEVTEFAKLAHEGHSWTQSAFMSSYFTLVGTHGLHITAGLLWLVVLIVMLLKKGVTATNVKRLTLFSLFWHFLDIVWIFIFSVVYLMGAL